MVYGEVVVNTLEPGVNLSAPGWTISFNGTNNVYRANLTLTWNQWRTNYWFDYSIVVPSSVTYTVTIHQANLTWATIQESVTPSGQNYSFNVDTTGPAIT